MRKTKKIRAVYISLLLIEIALYLLTDIYFMGYMIICTVIYGAAGALAASFSGRKLKVQITTESSRCRKGDEIEITAEAEAGLAARLLCVIALLEVENILTGQRQEAQAEFCRFRNGKSRLQFGLTGQAYAKGNEHEAYLGYRRECQHALDKIYEKEERLYQSLFFFFSFVGCFSVKNATIRR